MTATELKPRIRPVHSFEGVGAWDGKIQRFKGWLWECRAQRWTDRYGWVYIETYGKRGHGYTPEQAYKEWKAQQ